MNNEQWAAHSKFVHDVIWPAAVKAALVRPMTKRDEEFIEELKNIYDGEETAAGSWS